MNSESRIELALQSLGNAWPAEGSIATDVMRRINERAGRSVTPLGHRGLSRVWMAAAAAMALVAGLWWALRPDTSLYAQALKAVHRARTFRMIITVIPPGSNTPVQGIATYYERNVGLRVEYPEEVYLCVGKESWRYKKSQALVVHSVTPGIENVIDHTLDVEIGQALKDAEDTRYEDADQEIDDKPCKAYLIVKFTRQVSPDPTAGERRTIVLLDDQSRIVRVLTERRADDRWIAQVVNNWKYDLPLEAALFEPRFGDDVMIVDGDKAFDEFTSLDKAVYREDRSGITYGIHRAERVAGGGIALVTSVRGTAATLRKYPLTQRRIQFGLFFVDGPAQNLETSPQGSGYFAVELATADHQGINVRWWVLVPRGTRPDFFDAAPDRVRIPVGFTPRGEFGKAEFTDQRGITQHETWDVEINLPAAEERSDLDAIARHTYSDLTMLAEVPFRQLDMGVGSDNFKRIAKPDATTAEEFAQAVASHLRFWQQGDVDFQLEGQFTPESRKQFAAMPPMSEAIGLSYQPLVDDALLERVAEHKSLKRLYLNGTKITDAGLERLDGLGELEELSLEGTAISDAGLVHLAMLASLKKLSLGNTRVTSEGVERLKQAIPALTVRTEPFPRWWYGLSRELTAPRSP